MNWITAWGALWLAKLLAALGGWMVILAVGYLVASVLTAIVVLPLMLKHLAATTIPISRHGQGQFCRGCRNSLWAAILFIVGWLMTLPLWLVPGLGLAPAYSTAADGLAESPDVCLRCAVDARYSR